MPFIHFFFKRGLQHRFFFFFLLFDTACFLPKPAAARYGSTTIWLLTLHFQGLAEPRCSNHVPIFHNLGMPSERNLLQWKHLEMNNKGVIIPVLASRMLTLHPWLCFLSRDAQSYAAICSRLMNIMFLFPAPPCLPLQLLSHSLTLLSATYLVMRLHFFTCPYNILYAIVHTLRAKSL